MTNIIHWLLPKEEKFFLMLRDQASNVVEGANEFKNLIDNYNSLSDVKRGELVKKIKEIESKGDNIVHKIIGSLDKTFVTPIDKEDIHNLTSLLDDVIDLIYAASIRLKIFKIKIVDVHMKSSADIIQDTIKKIEMGVIGVSKLRSMNRFYIDIHTLENKADDLYHKALEDLFNNRNPVVIIKYKEIYDFLEDITDKCEDIANVIESIVVKHA
ncbi:MAG: DUF47 domain-containing protein [Nanoarchaeota archaeon]|nr:DUF47 domain-containing protein [Nanoarchaeota archaeon]